MPRPNAKWIKKYGHGTTVKRKVTRLSASDNVLSGAEKIAGPFAEGMAIVLQMIRHTGCSMMILLDMDDMEIHDYKIGAAYHEWAENNYDKLMEGIRDRETSLINFLRGR